MFIGLENHKKTRKIKNSAYFVSSGNAVPKRVNATRGNRVTQTTKKFEADTNIENQLRFRLKSNFSDMSDCFCHRWTIRGPFIGHPWKRVFWIQKVLLDGAWGDHAWRCMGVYGISVRESKTS